MAACSDNSSSTATDNTMTDNNLQASEQAPNQSNPFFAESTLPYGLPPFDQIRAEHFLPAFERAMQIELQEIERIANNQETASFENTIVAMERSGRDMDRVRRVFFNLVGANTSAELQQIQREISPRLSAHNDTINLNAELFSRLQHVYQQRNELNLDAESMRLLERYHTRFVRSGALLTEEQKTQLRDINSELASLGTAFSQNVLAEVNDSALLVNSREQLAGLSESQIQSAAQAAQMRGHDGQYLITLLNTSNQPILSSLSNRDLREQIHTASLQRGIRGNDYDTRKIVARTLRLRAERARLLGYDTHADYILSEQTAGSAAAVNEMLNDIVPVAVANARAEGEAIQEMINASESEPFELAAWDWSYYAEKVRAERYAFDESEVRPYFELTNVLTNGVFYAAEQVYGLTFKHRDDLPAYHDDVTVWEVFDTDGSPLGLMLTDFYARSSKRGGAWMNSYDLPSELSGGHPVIAMHQNITKPPVGEPTLLTFDEVTTMFHEFGHVLHGIMTRVNYPFFAGTAVPRDFVEFPSQVNEMWASWPQVLQNYARHYKTGEQIPLELLDKVLDAEQFNQGYGTTEYIAASVLDQALHQLPLERLPEADELINFEQQVLREQGLDYAPVPPRYRTAYFSHIMGGYSAGYYSYIWSEVLDADAVEWFRENGGMRRENGQHFRDTLLSRGGSADAMQLYLDFADRQPDPAHMLRRRGLAD
nr:M3 family metallopeptidase [Pseudohongiella spirulinae]